MIDLSLSFDVLDADEKAISHFCKYCERDVVWAASCERSYEGMRSADVRKYCLILTYARKILKKSLKNHSCLAHLKKKVYLCAQID